MLDLKRTVELIRGAIFEPPVTWEKFLPEADDWQKTAWLLTGPLVVGTPVLAYVMTLIFPSRMSFYTGPSFFGMLFGIVLAAAAAAGVAFLVSFLAGQFKGQHSFAKGLAGTSLAFVPGYLGQVLAPLPWIGWLLGLGLFIYSLVLLWRVIPIYLGVPDGSRIGHYILSLVACVLLFIVIGRLAAMTGAGGRVVPGDFSATKPTQAPSGMFGEMERQGNLLDAASADTYDPPRDGKLSDRQVRRYIDVMEKTQELRQARTEDLEKLAEKAEEKTVGSLSDVFSGYSDIMQLQTAEMDVVKTGGGNWAEHMWVKEQLRVAQIQKDINDAVKHNYALYQKYETELRAVE